MIIIMESNSTHEQIENVLETIKRHGFRPHISYGEEKTIIGVIGDERQISDAIFKSLPGVENVIPILKPYKLASREFKKESTIVKVDNVLIGNGHRVVIAGPCSVESEEQIIQSATIAKKCGANLLRGGAYKPRTSPYSFQGLGIEGLKLLQKAKEVTGLPIVTEVMEVSEVEIVAEYADVLQIGTRNMQNYRLLKAVGKINKPVLLKRGMSATLQEFLMSAEYILSEGNYNVILCERGIRTFVDYTRNTLDLNIIPAVKKLSHLPIVVDPSHGTGKRDYVIPLSLAAIAAGADGIIVEMHPDPNKSISDADQTISPKQFEELMKKIKSLEQLMKAWS
ncbi:MAG: 3-deoxy-7-phosphoheptulonate synthase [Ignavibacteria bacterium]|jgi:3-deoxy-7-phosphoheptulonate synthase|nr:3-deoxy-7-phosphoheptulonate synthase [Ignavibacteria bacterium]MDH7528111.1 3-deoxy-7-phosphoheptulonate synthase [Ignavibacteria bacterium]